MAARRVPPREGVPKIDVLQLLDRLEALINRGIHVPLSSKVVIDDPEFFAIVDQLRVAIPEELKQAKRVSLQRQQVISEAQREAQQIISEAEAYRQRLMDESEIIQAEQARANEIIREAERRAEEIRQGANSYANEVLNSLDSELSRTLLSIRKGRDILSSLIEQAENVGVGGMTADDDDR